MNGMKDIRMTKKGEEKKRERKERRVIFKWV